MEKLHPLQNHWQQEHGASNDNDERHAVFLKLRKTGGTTFSASVLFPYCIKNGLKFMKPQRGPVIRPKLIEGDNFYMMFRHFPSFRHPWAKRWLYKKMGNYLLITIIRDPVSRAVSAYNHFIRYQKAISFDEYLVKHHEINHQSTWLGFEGNDPDFLRTHFSMVGTTDRFNESMLLFRHTLGLELEDVLYIPQRNDAKNVTTREQLDAKTKSKILEVDWLDVKLYIQASMLVEEYVANTPEITREIKVYRDALNDFDHPLWEKRGAFLIGYSMESPWSEFTGRHGEVVKLREIFS